LFGIAAAFGVAAVAIVPIARQPRAQLVKVLAWGNTLGGAVLWGALAFYWTKWTPESRGMLAVVADGFVILGVIELFAVRRIAFR